MLNEAEGLADLGLWHAAWDALENLPAEERATPAALRVRLRCCLAHGLWSMGEMVASVLRGGGDADRVLVGAFFHALAVHHAKEGRMEEAREAVASAVDVSPGMRLALVDDAALVDVW